MPVPWHDPLGRDLVVALRAELAAIDQPDLATAWPRRPGWVLLAPRSTAVPLVTAGGFAER